MPTRLLIALLFLPGLARAQEAGKDDACLAAVQRLRADIRRRAAWDDLFATYKEAKAKVDEKGSSEACRAFYEKIRPVVANALRRDRIEWDGWITAFVGATLLWGGFMACVAIAWKSGKGGGVEAD